MNVPLIKRNLINEENLSNKTIINVDIQPEYADSIYFINDWVNFLNKNEENNIIVFLYNGYDTMGMVSESEYKFWLYELGVSEEVIDSSYFYDKGYAFFRYCMDEGIDDDEIIALIQFMRKHNINDSRDIDENMWVLFKEESGYDDISDLLETASEMINIPDLMDYINDFNNIVLTGGGINECLKEVELALLSLNKPYQILNQFTY